MFGDTYAGRRVLVTGHTGFKGSWLCTWLLNLGADVAGYSVDVPTVPSNFDVLKLEARLRHHRGDVRDRRALAGVFEQFRPECVFHLAAQPLVRRSYEDPVTTFEVNVLGTVNVLECIRHCTSVESAVIVTSDKCYRNVGWPWGYRENDVLGGDDPYSSSKGCAELVCYSYMRALQPLGESEARIASARAGNVIGGGDWAPDRLVPDCVQSWSKQETVTIRQPAATRPWQHVLEPLSGYLWLGTHLLRHESRAIATSYNFGPPVTVNHSVGALVQLLSRHWPGARWTVDETQAEGRPEAAVLKLSCDKALVELGWIAALSIEETARLTSEWYRRFYERGHDGMWDLTHQQIVEYCRRAQEGGLPWTEGSPTARSSRE